MIRSATAGQFLTEDEIFSSLPGGLQLGGRPAELVVRSSGVTLAELGLLADAIPGLCNARSVTHADRLGGTDGMRQALRAALASHGSGSGGVIRDQPPALMPLHFVASALASSFVCGGCGRYTQLRTTTWGHSVKSRGVGMSRQSPDTTPRRMRSWSSMFGFIPGQRGRGVDPFVSPPLIVGCAVFCFVVTANFYAIFSARRFSSRRCRRWTGLQNCRAVSRSLLPSEGIGRTQIVGRVGGGRGPCFIRWRH